MEKHKWLFNFHMSFFTIFLTGMLILIYKPSAASSSIFYVAPEGDCGGQTPCYANPQQAVDAALSGDEIRVAAGIYTGVNNIGGKSQHLYINKNLLLRGGYSISDWNVPDPEINVTELQAQVQGRVVFITGDTTTVTIDGFHLTFGDASGLGGHPYGNDSGGNIFIDKASVNLFNCEITDGTVPSDGYGGGLYIKDGTLKIVNTLFDTNEAGHGGAAYISGGETDIDSCTFTNNRTTMMTGPGPAIKVDGGSFAMNKSVISGNVAVGKAPNSAALDIKSSSFQIDRTLVELTVSSPGIKLRGNGYLKNSEIHDNQYGGVSISDGVVTVIGNDIYNNGSNTAYAGAGLSIMGTWDLTANIIANHIHDNYHYYAFSRGGGVYVDTAEDGLVSLIDNLIENNRVGSSSGNPGFGGGIIINGDSVILSRNRIQNNTAVGWIDPLGNYLGGQGGGILINGDALLMNNIISNNHATFSGSGLCITGSAPELYHNTITFNSYSDEGTGVYVAEASSSERAEPKLWNNIITNQLVGIYVKGDVTNNVVISDGILWYENNANTGGTGTFFLSHEYTGDPMYVDVAGNNFHIAFDSAAIDHGVLTNINSDFDKEPRFGIADLGADEYWAPGILKRLFLPLLTK